MSGFKNFILRGNLVELAVAVIMGTSFAAVVTAFTGMLLSAVSTVSDGKDPPSRRQLAALRPTSTTTRRTTSRSARSSPR